MTADTTKRVDVDAAAKIADRVRQIASTKHRITPESLRTIADTIDSLRQQVAELEAKLAERDAELTRIERENRAGWKQAKHWRQKAEAAERAIEGFSHVAPLLLELATSHECDTLTHQEVSDLRNLAAFLAANGERDGI